MFSGMAFYRATGARSNQGNYRTYYNTRFTYSISYPADILSPQGEADNGDGQKFLSKDGRTQMLVYGSPQLKVLNQTLKSLYLEASRSRAADRPKKVVTYTMIKSDWFIVSGYEDGRIFYQKTMLKKGAFKTFRIEYDEAQKSIFDPIITRIASSFRG